MENNKIIVKSGFLIPLVFLVFLTLKLAEVGVVATWSWWWVTAPLWVPVAVVMVILIVWWVSFLVYKSLKKRR